MRNVFAVFFLLSLRLLWAQSPHLSGEPGVGNSQLDSRLQETIMEHWALNPGGERQSTARKEADARLREFYTKAEHFVALWGSLAHELNDRKTFDAKLAKQVSKAFHDLEKSDGWPAGRSQ